MKYFILAMLWILWCCMHSFLVTTTVTAWFKKRTGDEFAFYRISYNLLSLITVLPLLYWQNTIPGPVIIELSPFLLIFKYSALVLSAMVITGSLFSFDMTEFLGIRQITDRMRMEAGKGTHGKDKKIKDGGGATRGDGRKTMDKEKSKTKRTPIIKKHGFYSIVRHPMYLGGAVFFTACMMNASAARFIGYAILAVYMVIGAFREDGRLARELGKAYTDYQKEVPMFLPGISGKSR